MTDTTTSLPHAYEEDEISLLDILVTLAASWKLLVFGPVLAGVLAGALSFLLPNTYESVAIVRLAEQELGLLSSAPVLDSVIAKFDLLAESGGIQDDAREAFAKKIVGKFDKKTGLATITASARTPEQAKAIADAVMASLLRELLPKGKNKDLVEQTIRANERLISGNADAIEQLRKQIGKSGQGEGGLDVVMKYYAVLNAEIAKKELENVELRNSLDAKSDEVYVQRPSLPQRKVSRKSSMVVIATMFVSCMLLLFWVFVCQSWGAAMQSPESAGKVIAIKRSLGWKH